MVKKASSSQIMLLFLNTVIKSCMHAKSLQLSLTLCDPMDYSPPGSSVHGILQARILEWVAISFSRGFSTTRDEPASLTFPALAGEFFTTSSTWEATSTIFNQYLHGSFFPPSFYNHLQVFFGFPDSSVGKESTCNAGNPGSIPGSVGKILWRSDMLLISVF